MSDQNQLSRRDMLWYSLVAGVGGGMVGGIGGCSQIKSGPGRCAKNDGPKWRLGMDTYTLHRTITAKDPALRKDVWQVLDEMSDYGITGAQIDPSHFPGSDESTMQRLADMAKTKGYYFEFGMWRWHPVEMKERLEQTSRFGGKAVRTFFCDQTTSDQQKRQAMIDAEPAFREAGKMADDIGVDIAIENHGDYTGEQLAAFIERVDHPRVGACLDTGNSLFQKEDPIVCAERLAPFALSMHLKDWRMSFDEKGRARYTETAIGEGEVPLREVLEIVVKYKPVLYAALEVPIWPSDDEREMVEREHRNYVTCAAGANKLLREMNLL